MAAISFLFGGIRNPSKGRGLIMCCCMDIDLPSVSKNSNTFAFDTPMSRAPYPKGCTVRRVTIRGGCRSNFRHNKPCFRRQDTRSDIYLIRLQATRRLSRTRIRSRWDLAGGSLQVRSPAASIKALIAQCTIHISESTRHGVAANYPLASALITDLWGPRSPSRIPMRKEADWDTVK